MGILIGVIILAIIIRIIAGSMDSDRVKEDIEAKGGKMISKEWAPFGKGWIGEKNDRIYEVFYIDKDGNKHKAYVKTSLLSAVYYASDEIIEYANYIQTTEETSDALKIENEKLKREIEELKTKIN
jgi:hypothetical protein